ncbi:lamin B [Clonorchis sinensis]|uniref:Lamin B n=1 Tax=Clonorchis sinensis TaxID=79923 RepID=G7Y526_CLOSI|nr:lamin B [Clonorchis sinensis]
MARDFYRTAVALQISEINPQGRFVKIHNADSEGYNLSACKLMQTVDGDLLNEYEFDQPIYLPSKTSITLWTNDINNKLSQQNHSASIRCQNVPCWGSGPNCITSLYSPSGQLLAQLCGFNEANDDGVVRSSKMTSEECSCTTIGLPTTIPKKSGDSQTGSREIPDLFHKIKKNSLTQQVPKFKSAYYSTNQARN